MIPLLIKKDMKRVKDCTEGHVKLSIIIPYKLKTLMFS